MQDGTVRLYGSRVGRIRGIVNRIADWAAGRKDKEREALEVREVGFMRQDAFRIMPGLAVEVGFMRKGKRTEPDVGGGRRAAGPDCRGLPGTGI